MECWLKCTVFQSIERMASFSRSAWTIEVKKNRSYLTFILFIALEGVKYNRLYLIATEADLEKVKYNR